MSAFDIHVSKGKAVLTRKSGNEQEPADEKKPPKADTADTQAAKSAGADKK